MFRKAIITLEVVSNIKYTDIGLVYICGKKKNKKQGIDPILKWERIKKIQKIKGCG